MIKNKKYNNSKGGKIPELDFDPNIKTKTRLNKDKVFKKEIMFNINLDNTPQQFKITQHTFAHFDEFSNTDLNDKINKFTHIIQYFVLFIFLLNSMGLKKDDFINLKDCGLPNTCKISNKSNLYKKLNLTLYIDNNSTADDSGYIFITSLFENTKQRNQSKTNKDITNIELNNNKNNNNILFSLDTINNLLNNQQYIIKNDYDINTILQLLIPDYEDPTLQPKQTTSPEKQPTSPQKTKAKKQTSPEPQKSPGTGELFPITYEFSIPKAYGGKKTKNLKKRKYKRRKTRKK